MQRVRCKVVYVASVAKFTSQLLEIEASYLDGQLIAAYIHFPGNSYDRSARCECVDPGLVIDYASCGRPMGIEVIMPRMITLETINSVMRRRGVTEMSDRDFAPLRPA